MSVSEAEDKEQDIEALFNEIIAEKFSNPWESMAIQIKELQRLISVCSEI